MHIKLKTSIWLASTFLMMLTLSIFSSSVINGTIPASNLYNADALYIPTLLKDLLENPAHYKNWWLTPAPYYFPDWIFYAATSIFSENTEGKILNFGLAQITATWVITLFLTKKISGIFSPLVSAISTSLAVAMAITQPQSIFAFIYVSGYHFGCYLLGLVLLITITNENHQPHANYVIYTICGIGALSDSLFTASFAIPSVLALALIGQRLRAREREYQATVITIFAGSISGHFAYNLITPNPTRYSLKPDITHAGNNISVVIDILTQSMLSPVFLTIIGASGLALSFYAIRRKPISRQLAILLIFFTIQSILLITLTTFSKGLAVDRYFQSMLFTPILVGPAVISSLTQSALTRTTTWLSLSAILFLLLSPIIRSTPYNPFSPIVHYPPQLACIDSIAKTYKLRFGVGDYWDAKPISLFSKNGITVAPVSFTERGIIERKWITSTLIFNNRYDFIAIRPNNTLHISLAEKHLPSPDVIKHCEGMDIWLYTRNSLILKKN
jgi:hypothetical protein